MLQILVLISTLIIFVQWIWFNNIYKYFDSRGQKFNSPLIKRKKTIIIIWHNNNIWEIV